MRNMVTENDIGRRIWRARRAAGISQANLAGLLGVSRQTVRNWERGRTAPSGHMAADLLEWLGHAEGAMAQTHPAPEAT